MAAHQVFGRLAAWSNGKWQRVVRWVDYGTPIWKWILTVSGLCVTTAIFAAATGYPSARDDEVCLVGLVLQLVGLVAIVRDLDSVARGFGGQSILAPAKEFWNFFLDTFRGPRTFSVDLTGVASARASARGFAPTVMIESHGTIEERVTNLEEWRKQQVTTVIPEIRKAITDEGEKIRSEISQERLERDARDKEFAGTVREAMIGDLKIKLGGFAYVVLGTILTTVPFG